MPFLGIEPVQEFASVAKQTITGTGATAYSLDHSVASANDLAVFVNNVRQEPTSAYTASGGTITFTSALASTDSCYVMYIARTFSSAYAEANSIGITELNVSEGTSGQALTTNGSGTLSFSTPTLDAVTGAGATTTNAVTVGNLTSTGDLTVDTDTLVVDSTNNRVGINVSDPDAVLEVFTSDYATGPYFHGGGSLGLRIADSTITSAGDRTEFYKPTSSGMFSFKNGLKELLTIKASGRIGSDETNPQDRIHIKGSLPALRLENTAGAADSYTRIASIDGAVRIQADQGNSTANSFIAFDVDTAEAARITSSGNFGIGTPTPAVILETNVASGNNEIRQSVGGTPTAQLISSTTNQYLVNLGSGVQSFWTGGSERMSILPSGGITFNGDTAAANALDDYEEGTWTPRYEALTTDFSSVTYVVQDGFYQKVGNTLHTWLRLRISSYTGSPAGLVVVAGWPFTPSGGVYQAGTIAYSTGWTNSPQNIYTQTNQGYAMLSKDGSSGLVAYKWRSERFRF